MADQNERTRSERRPRAGLSGLLAARWPLGGAFAALALLVLMGRMGALDAALAFAFAALAAMVAPAADEPERPADVSGSGALPAEVSAILSGLPEPVLVLNRRALVVAFNERARAVFGEIRIGEPVSFVLRTPEVLEAVRAAGPAPQTVLYVERAPVERWREACVAQVRLAPSGRPITVVALRDLTEQRRSERMRGDFVANASHELRTPLASLLGFIETLQGPAKNDAQAREKFLDIMRTQANRMSRLIDDLLSLSRIELKAHVRPQTVVDLDELVRGVTDALSPLANERGVEILLAAEPTAVYGDRDELIRVAENLIENAIKYGQSGKRVEVAVKPGPDGGALTVRDHGPGVSPEHLPRLTERFYRVDVGDSRNKGGTGLGLALVKHIVQRHGGKLSIESAPGEGATFSVLLRGAAAERSTELRAAS